MNTREAALAQAERQALASEVGKREASGFWQVSGLRLHR
jgi:hypothetical protein